MKLMTFHFAHLSKNIYYYLKAFLLICAFMAVHIGLYAQAKQTKSDSLHQKLSEAKTDTAKLNLYLGLAVNYDFTQSDSCEFYAKKLLTLTKKYDNKTAEGHAYLLIGNANFSKGDFTTALQNYIDCINICEKLQPYPKILGQAYGEMCSIYGELNDYPLGNEYAEKCLNFYQNQGTPKQIASSYNNVANFYEIQKHYDKTIFYSQKAIEITEKYHLTFSKAIAYFNMGIALRKSGKYLEAKPYLKKAIETSREVDDTEGLIYNYIELGNIYETEKKLSTALIYVDSALLILKNYSSRHLSKDAYFLKSRIFKQKKQYDSAYVYMEKFTTIKDSILDANNQKLIHNFNTNQKIYTLQAQSLQKQEDLNKQIKKNNLFIIIGIVLFALILTLFLLSWQKTKHNQLLQAKNIEIEHQKEELSILNNNKDKLISIISHDLRSPFNQIKSLLNLLNINVISQADFSIITQKLNQQVNTISDNLENLLQWAQTQLHGKNLNKEEFLLMEALTPVLELYESAFAQKQLSVNMQIPEGLSLYIDKEHLKVALRNLIGNAIKFSHENTSLDISAGEKGAQVFILIKDNGVGMTKQQVDNLFGDTRTVSTLGTLKEAGAGFGLRLSKEFIEKTGGQLAVESELGKGTTFTIYAPKKAF